MGLPKLKSVVIVGAGIVGLCCAWYLSKAGFEVTVLDQNPQGSDNCSQGNSGMIVPSHFVPLASPGMIGYGLRQMLRADSPFGISSPFDPQFISWSRHFAQAATKDRCDAASLVLRDLQLASRQLFSELHEQWGGSFSLNTRGLLSLALTQEQIADDIETIEAAHRLGIRATLLDANGLSKLDPKVRTAAIGGIHFLDDACIDPSEFTRELSANLVARGVCFQWGQVLSEHVSAASTLTSLRSDTARYRADYFVLAAGIGTKEICQKLGLKLPMMAGRGYSITLPHPSVIPGVCALVPEVRLAMTPMTNQVRFGGTFELGRSGMSPNPSRIEGILDSVRRVYPDFAGSDLESYPVWSGDRPCTPDGLPYIGHAQPFGNLMIAAGHAMSGVSLAPITGKLIAQSLTGELPPYSHPLLDPNRYA